MTASPRGDLDPPTLPAPTGGPGWSNTATDAALRARPYVLARGLAPWLSFARRVPGWVRRVRRPGGPPQPAGGLRLTHGEVALLLAVLTMLACLGVAFGAAAQRSRAGAGLPAGADRQGEWSGPVGPDAAPWWFPRPSPTGPA
ncbi:MAG: hypothetical protein IRZ08_18180, partial [Frankia sp.]|nr:hypothetical protein [Frankia sp.]